MRYDRIYKAKFIERPNRFIAYAELNGKKETVHVKNTGRCAELLRPGADIYIQESDNPSRKTWTGGRCLCTCYHSFKRSVPLLL